MSNRRAMFRVEIVAGSAVVETATYWLADMKAALVTARLLYDTVNRREYPTALAGFVITDQLSGAVLRFEA